MATTFSYAQAAKGLVAPSTSNSQPAKASPETQSNSVQTTSDAQSNKPDVSEPSAAGSDATSMQDSHSTITDSKPTSAQDLKSTSPQINGISPPASPDFGVSSTSTLVKDDDQSSAVHTSSESTWENKSQASGVADLVNGDAAERPSELEKGKSSNKEMSKDTESEAVPAKSLQDAPPPVVNIWKKRAQERAAVVPSPTKASAPAKQAVPATSKSHSLPEPNLASAVRPAPPRERKPEAGPGRNQSEPRGAHGRRENDENLRPRRSQGPRAAANESNQHANVPLPPTRDQQSWPTPETATEEEKKKSVEKVDKAERPEKSDEDATEKKKIHGKSAWTHVPFTPTVVFSTPLPGSGRRGGRGGGRGGREDSSRGGSHAASNVNATGEDKKPAQASTPTTEQPQRGRPESTVRSGSPRKDKADVPVPEPIPAANQQASASTEASVKPELVNGDTNNLPNRHQRRFSVDRASNANAPYPTRGGGARGRGRRGDFAANATERRRDLENGTFSSDQAANGQISNASVSDGPDRRKKSISEESSGAIKQQQFERRNGGFSTYPNPRERGEPRGRGGMRGRGGSHHFQANQQLANGQYGGGPGSMTPQQYGYSSSGSPQGWMQGQAGPYFDPSSQSSRGYRGGQRAQSVATEMMYGNPYSGMPPHMAPIQTQMGYGFEAQAAQSMSAAPYSPYAAEYSIYSMVAVQLEYYFSMDNLIKDVYLRKHMDSKGFVFLSVVANFSRMKKLTTDIELIKLACAHSTSIEWRIGSDGKDRVRPVNEWQQWVMPMEERDPSARNEGSAELSMPSAPMPQGFDHNVYMRHSLGGPMPKSAAASTAPWQQTNGGRLPHSQSPMFPPDFAYGQQLPPQAHQMMSNGYGPREQYAQGQPMVNGHSQPMDPEADTFTDAQAASLKIVVGKSNGEQSAIPPAATRTFSNGSIDGNELTDGAAAAERQDSVPIVDGDDSHRGRTGRPGTKHTPSVSQDSSASTDGARLCWIKSDDRPVNMIPGPQETERYPVLRTQALQERQDAPEGVSPHNLVVLYQFWSHFLLRNFNTNMYNEFRMLALQDKHERQTDTGYEHLLKYYQQALASKDRPIRNRVARHYVYLVLAEQANENDQDRIALKQLRTQWHDTATDAQNLERLSAHVDDNLKSTLEEETST